jgi:serine/threonine-protein phosphatase 2A regulatory subunit A
MCLSWLQDCVHTIREAATLNLRKLAKLFGPEWAQKQLLPHVLAPHTHTNYLYRLTALYAATGFAAVVSQEALLTSILPLVLQMTADPVPNVRRPLPRCHP